MNAYPLLRRVTVSDEPLDAVLNSLLRDAVRSNLRPLSVRIEPQKDPVYTQVIMCGVSTDASPERIQELLDTI